jgi:hypothetical protein
MCIPRVHFKVYNNLIGVYNRIMNNLHVLLHKRLTNQGVLGDENKTIVEFSTVPDQRASFSLYDAEDESFERHATAVQLLDEVFVRLKERL